MQNNVLDFKSEYQKSIDKEDISFFDDLTSLYNNTHDLLCIADFNAKFKRVNPAVVKLLGYSEEELFSHSINYFVHPDDQNDTVRTRNEMFEGKPLLNYENRYVKKSGEIVWLSWTSIPKTDRQLVFAIAKDITLRKKIEEEKNQLYQKLEVANKELKYFARVASHDLRAPISNIIALFDLMDQTKIEDEESLNIIGLIKKSTETVFYRLEKYIDDLQNKDRSNLLKTDENISDISKNIIESIENLLKKQNAKVELDFSAFDTIKFDKGYLSSIIQNLITNAVKYCSPNRTPEIKVLTRMLGHKKQLLVIDNGLGMDFNLIKDKIFGLNQTFHQNKDGRGLGLYLVKTQIEEMCGSIDVETELDKGSTFILTFASD
ncbi:MAG: PAS domain-containing sensor histidine kinase [Oligoflexus sp.]|nr:PAS domain-containing sensor histidine kinase [Pseudopedobacter sp.]